MYYMIIKYKEFDNGYDVKSHYYMCGLDKATANSIARHMNKVDLDWKYGVEIEPDVAEFWR